MKSYSSFLGKIGGIFLLILLLYNTIGFSVMYFIEDEIAMEEATENFNLSDEYITLKIPLSVPYQSSWKTSEPAKGKILHKEVYYNIVEKQLIQDTLHVRCKVDKSARERFFALVEHVNSHVKDVPVSHKSNSKILKSFIKEYVSSKKAFVVYVIEWNLIHENTHKSNSSSICHFLEINNPPPESLLA